jgi:hypothetical protein
MMTISPPPPKIFLKDKFPAAHLLSLIVAVLMGLLSMAGLITPERIYPFEESRQTFIPNDLVNLVIGLPILLGSIWLARRGALIGLLLWPGALLYVVYNYTAYLFGSQFGWSTAGYLALVLLSTSAIYILLGNMDQEAVKEELTGVVPAKTAGWVLTGFGLLFLFRALGLFVSAGIGQTALPVSEIGVLSADLVLAVIWIAGGVTLLRKLPIGYVSGLGLLFVGSMLFIGLILFLLLQPILTEVPFDPVSVIIIFLMGLICFLPFGLFVRGILSTRKS